jgi:hypothetical protein
MVVLLMMLVLLMVVNGGGCGGVVDAVGVVDGRTAALSADRYGLMMASHRFNFPKMRHGRSGPEGREGEGMARVRVDKKQGK